ncbi:MAG: sigma-70 family RNA polymerase sigma factor [Cyanobacteriota bacterium]|nr:sigma-70 family RNA polymerase sigma factor [Cyanobacteriota bacterium]
MQSYLERIATIPLLTPAEEVHLGSMVQRWRQASSPSASMVRAGRRAMDRMVRANLRLVVSVCKHEARQPAGVELLDLIQVGNLGLIRAVERFDPSRGYRFSTYAYWWIRQAVRRGQAELGQLLRVPQSIRKLAGEVQTLRQASPSRPLDSIASSLGSTRSRIAHVLEATRAGQVISLDQSHGPEDEGSLLDRLSDGREPQEREDYDWLHQSLARLPAQARRVLALRYGGDDPCSLSQVAHHMGLTKSTVQGLEQRALRELRGSLHPRLQGNPRCRLSA